MNTFFRLFCFSSALLAASVSFAQDEPDLTNDFLYRCRVPGLPGAFDQPDVEFTFSKDSEVVLQVVSAWNNEEISREKVVFKAVRKVNRLGRVFPLTGAVIEERVRTANFSYVLMIPASDDGVYFKEEQGQNEPTSFEEEVSPTDLLAPGSVSFKVPGVAEEGGFDTETWSLVCQVSKAYRDQALDVLNHEESKSVSPVDIYKIFRGLLDSVMQVKALK